MLISLGWILTREPVGEKGFPSSLWWMLPTCYQMSDLTHPQCLSPTLSRLLHNDLHIFGGFKPGHLLYASWPGSCSFILCPFRESDHPFSGMSRLSHCFEWIFHILKYGLLLGVKYRQIVTMNSFLQWLLRWYSQNYNFYAMFFNVLVTLFFLSHKYSLSPPALEIKLKASQMSGKDPTSQFLIHNVYNI